MRLFTLGLSILSWLCLVGAMVTFFYYYDPSRIFFMGLKSKNSFAFEPLPLEMTEMDFSNTIGLASQQDAQILRYDLQNHLYHKGQGLDDFRFSASQTLLDQGQVFADREDPCEGRQFEISRPTVCQLSEYQAWPELAKLTQHIYKFPFDYKAFAYVFHPKLSNGQAVIYHHGYAGTFHDQALHLKRLLAKGYSVGALNIPTYGENMRYNADISAVLGALNGKFDLIDRPLSLFLDPVHALVNHLSDDLKSAEIHMMGLSAGAWVTSLSAALDPRILHSYPIAGVMPIALRQGDKERAAPQFYPPLLEVANYLEIFTLGAGGINQRQVQIFNRYDRCCFNNIRGKLYEKDVQDALIRTQGGTFEVWIDETHARHKISNWTITRILEDLKK